MGDLHGVVKTAGFHQLDVDEVAGPHRQQAENLIGAEGRFVGHDVGFHMIGHIFQPVKVMRLHRLLDQFDVQTVRLEAADRPDRLLGIPALVGVEPDLDDRADGVADGLHPPDIQRRVVADLQLERGVAFGHGFQRIAHHFVRLVQADGQVGLHAPAVAAEQFVERQAVAFAEQVVHGDIQGGLGGAVVQHAAVQRRHDAFDVVDVHADELGRERVPDRGDDGVLAVAGDHGGRRRVAKPDFAGVGHHFDDDVLRRMYGAQGRFEGFLERDADFADFDRLDLHAGPTLLICCAR